MEFWGTLAKEDGDDGWRTGTNAFLGMIKKGTKTPSGMNLREIPTLLEGELWVDPVAGAEIDLHQHSLLPFQVLPPPALARMLTRPTSFIYSTTLFPGRPTSRLWLDSSPRRTKNSSPAFVTSCSRTCSRQVRIPLFQHRWRVRGGLRVITAESDKDSK